MGEEVTDQEKARRYCEAKKSGGGNCRRPAGDRTSHPGYGRCYLHSGSSPGGIVKAARDQVAEIASLSTDIDVDPDTVMLSAIGRAWGAVYWTAERIEGIQREADALGPDEDSKRRSELTKLLLVMNKMYGEWLDRSVAYSKAARDAGIAERRVQLEEEKVTLFATAMRQVLNALNLTPEQKARESEVVSRVLLSLADADREDADEKDD